MKKKGVALVMALGLTFGIAHANVSTQNSTPQLCDYPASTTARVSVPEVTRGAFLQRLAVLSDEDYAAYAQMKLPFADCPSDAAAAWGYSKWIISGDDAGNVRLTDVLTRDQAAVMISRYLNYKFTALPKGFCGTGMPPAENIPLWARDAVIECVAYGIMPEGQTDFRPKDPVSAADAAEWEQKLAQFSANTVHPAALPAYADSLVGKIAPTGNFMVSPYSIRMALGMVTNGAKGETQAELLRALGIDSLSAVNQKSGVQMESYAAMEPVIALQTANSIWLNSDQLQKNAAFRADFVSTLQKHFDAQSRKVSNKDSVEQVNAWVKDKTHGKIDSIIDENNRKFAAAAVNAVYFKAAWKQPFDEEQTRAADFHNADGTVTKTDMMHQQGYFSYFSQPDAQIVSLPYATLLRDENGEVQSKIDADLSMYLILSDRTDVQNLLDNAAFIDGQVSLTMPKFQVEYQSDLRQTLQKMGAKLVFDPDAADLSGIIAEQPLFIDALLHKTFIDVNEQGTEAAAVTFAGMAGSGLPPRPPLVYEFCADKPFSFAVRDNVTGEMLFVGRYEKAE